MDGNLGRDRAIVPPSQMLHQKLARFPTPPYRALGNVVPLLGYPRSWVHPCREELKLMNLAGERLSVVIPVYDEKGSVEALAALVLEQLEALGGAGEIVFVDDGSEDGTTEILGRLANRHRNVRMVRLRRNFGKAAALTAGFAEARGELILTLDGDLQDDPGEIPRMLEKLDEGFDVVSGWKRERRDPWHKRLPSRVFNSITSSFGGLRLKDHNSGFKLYRREVLQHIELVGEMHRFIAVMAHWQGFKVTEIPVRHHPRRSGRSKYGATRLVKGFFDFLTLLLTTRYNLRPLHLFGTVGLAFTGIGFILLSYLSALWFMGRGPIGTRPLLFLGLLLMMVGVQFVSTGLLAELIVRQTLRTRSPRHEASTTRKLYEPAEISHRQSDHEADHRTVRGADTRA